MREPIQQSIAEDHAIDALIVWAAAVLTGKTVPDVAKQIIIAEAQARIADAQGG